jgi:hypothetical protein
LKVRRRLLVLPLLCSAVALGASSQAATGASGNSYRTYDAPTQLRLSNGEPSLGVDWKTGAAFVQAGLTTAKVTFDAAGAATWTDVTAASESLISLDAIAASDTATGRFFVSQLTAVGSVMSYTDNDGQSWQPSQGSGTPAGVDHQTVGAGPYPTEGVTRLTGSYPDAVYYCSQDIGTALCARSDNGGQTFGAGIPTYTEADCIGLHGHVRVGPNGVVYLPNKNCNGKAAVVVSSDAGLTWTVNGLPGSTSSSNDPSVAAGRDGTAFVSWVNADGTVHAAVSTDRGRTWGNPYDLGAQVGVLNAELPSTIAGDGDRAAVAFYGTTTEGDGQNQYFGQDGKHLEYVGAEQHLYVATTYNRGKSWKTVDVTPKDPVQRGRICLGGTSCSGGDRNLLDFLDINLDASGHVLVAWTDGCTGICVDSTLVAQNTHTDLNHLTRQTTGQPLFAHAQKASS